MTNERLRLLKDLAEQSNVTIAAAESLTSGRIQALLGSVSGISSVFRGGITAYDLGSKVSLLTVDEAHAGSLNCVSERVAREMARGVASAFCVSVGVSTTGYAEPNTEWRVSVPYAHCCALRHLANGEELIIDKRVQGRSNWTREEMQTYVADEAIQLIFECLSRS